MKQQKCFNENNEIKKILNDIKTKLDGKQEELMSWQNKLSQLTLELKHVLPETTSTGNTSIDR